MPHDRSAYLSLISPEPLSQFWIPCPSIGRCGTTELTREIITPESHSSRDPHSLKIWSSTRSSFCWIPRRRTLGSLEQNCTFYSIRGSSRPKLLSHSFSWPPHIRCETISSTLHIGALLTPNSWVPICKHSRLLLKALHTMRSSPTSSTFWFMSVS